MNQVEDVLLAEPRGFCAGVDRAIEIVERALAQFGAPIYVRHEIVHNTYVVNDLKSKGAIFIEDLAEVPPGATLIFSAHGVSQEVRREADARGFQVFDATCPLVTKVHMEVVRYSREGRECILIGHEGHPEVEGTMGQYDASNGGAIYLVEDEADVAELQVRDEGIGIPAAELPQVFERHFRGSAARQHRASGSGLGLPIARALAQAHGGTLELQSPWPLGAEGGTCAVLRLPLWHGAQGGHAALQTPPNTGMA